MATLRAQALNQPLTFLQPSHKAAKTNFMGLFLQANTPAHPALILHVSALRQTLQHLDQMFTRYIKN